MAEITASLVKELRERTGAGMMECKKALVEANGDIELAIDNMRKSGQAKAAKKAGRVAAEGVILARVQNGFGVLVEMNCETDFVAKDAGFLGLANEVADFAAANKGATIEQLQAQFEEKRAALVAKIGENMTIRRVAYIEGDVVGSYLHGAKIGVLVAGKGADDELSKHIAMQSGKPREIAEKMVEGRMKKFTGEVSLTGQPFVMDPSKSVGDLLKEKGADISNFIRLEVGEGIEKVETDFAAEVAAMSKA